MCRLNRDTKPRELEYECLSRTVEDKMDAGRTRAGTLVMSCSSNSASTRHLTFASTNLLITDVGTAGRDSISYGIIMVGEETFRFLKGSLILTMYKVFLLPNLRNKLVNDNVYINVRIRES